MSAGAGVGLRSERGPVLLALMVSMALVALDSTVLATAVPSIVGSLGGFSLFPWLFSVYLLAQAVTVPVYAKLSDTIGRKPVMLAGISIFLVGSVLAGLAWSMPVLIGCRLVQGLGAGAIQPATSTIAGDIYTVEERGKAQGYLSGVWAVAAVLGPAIGGLFSQFATWRWIFFINVPVCLVAMALLLRSYHEHVERRRVHIDSPGAVLLAGGLSLLILAVLDGGQAWAWVSPPSVGGFALGAACIAAFVLVERHTADPVLPLWVLSRRLLLTTTLVSLGVGAVLIGLSSYVPTFLEGSIGTVPLLAGLAVAAQSIGWPIASSFSGRVYMRFGFRNTAVLGMSVIVLGALVLFLASVRPNVWAVAACCLVIGAGLGLSSTPAIVAAQSSVGWGERGVVTGSNMLARAIGSSVGVAIFGAVANSIVASSGLGPADPATIIASARGVFLAVLACGILGLAAAAAMPRTVAGVP
ncbi:MFS transporter [Arthrobacter livingstonensis]|uniref:MFS transporter n=1 Tax=Arthrobacter livingstonensis TaxID=670078 RepID=A0A2V5L6Y8_9MICC|nr:MFS transporter [Arthrobacter livingstonensis]PYI66014.1 MFS transporter [Arthrobacter livingstonensis]